MSFVVTTLRLPVGRRPVHLWNLSQALKQLGVPKFDRLTRTGKKSGTRFHLRAKQPESELWFLYEQAKEIWLAGIKRFHPDKGGDTKICALWNAIWIRIKELFARKRIGI